MSGERIETAGEVVAQARICPSCHDDHYEPGWLARHDAAVTAQADAEVRRLTDALTIERDEARAALRDLAGEHEDVTDELLALDDRAEKAEAERDEARVEAGRAWEQADRAEAVVARVRALLDRPPIPSALLRDALDGVDAGGEGK